MYERSPSPSPSPSGFTNPPSTRLFIGNVDYQISVSELKNALSQNLDLHPAEVHVATDKVTGQGKGFAFLTFSTIAESKAALALLNGFLLMQRCLRADYAMERMRHGRSLGDSGGGSRGRQPEVSQRRSHGGRSRGGPRFDTDSAQQDYDRTWRDIGNDEGRRRR